MQCLWPAPSGEYIACATDNCGEFFYRFRRQPAPLLASGSFEADRAKK